MGLRALVEERRRGLDRELAAAADEGVVETLVADAGAVRAELEALEPDSGVLAEQGLEVEASERALARERAELLATVDDADPVAEAEAVRRELAARRDGLVRIEEELARFDTRARGLEQRKEQLAFDLDAATEKLRAAESTVPSAVAAARDRGDRAGAGRGGARRRRGALRRGRVRRRATGRAGPTRWPRRSTPPTTPRPPPCSTAWSASPVRW